MRELDVGEHRRERLFQTSIAGVRVCHLPCLVILTAKDHDVVVAMSLESEVVIRIRGVPEEPVSNGALPDASGDRIAGVQRQLGLKDRGARHPREANQWIVRRDDDLTGMDPVAVRLHAPRLFAELLGLGVLEDLAAILANRGRHTCEVLARMEPRLIVETHTRATDEWHAPDGFGVEAQFCGELRLLLKRL